jgi:LysR family nitrogen assimilation transcriptional regulator
LLALFTQIYIEDGSYKNPLWGIKKSVALDLLKLRYFSKIAEFGSFTRAAHELGVAQPALSLHMRSLEEQLAVQLLTRTPRGVVVTEAGTTLLTHTQAILKALDQAEAATKEQAKNPTGDVSLGVLASIAPLIAVPILKICENRFPKIRLTISEGDSQTLRGAIETKAHDLAVNLGEVARPTASPLFDEMLYAVGPAGHFTPDESSISIRQALDLPLILPTRRHGIRILLERESLILGKAINIVREIEGLASTKAAIGAGFGFTVLGRGAIFEDFQKGALSVVPLAGKGFTRRLVLDSPVDHPQTKAVVEVRNILLEVVHNLGEQGNWSCIA